MISLPANQAALNCLAENVSAANDLVPLQFETHDAELVDPPTDLEILDLRDLRAAPVALTHLPACLSVGAPCPLSSIHI